MLAENPTLLPLHRVLVIEDDAEFGNILLQVLTPECDPVLSTSGAQALNELKRNSFDLVICDLMLNDMLAADVYRFVIAHHPHLAKRFLIITGGAYTRPAQEFISSVSVPVLEKPFTVQVFHKAIRSLLAEVEKLS